MDCGHDAATTLDHLNNPTCTMLGEPPACAKRADDDSPGEGAGDGAGKKKRRRRRRSKKPAGEAIGASEASEGAPESSEGEAKAPRGPRNEDRAGSDADAGAKKKRRRRGKKAGSRVEDADGIAAIDEDPDAGEVIVQRKTIDTHDPEVFDLEQTFAQLGLNEDILRALGELNFRHPTKIQAALIPAVLSGRDVLGQAKTGTGKTAAFGLPMLQRVEKGKRFGALVLGPTRELAVQITDDFKRFGKYVGLRTCTVYGGQSIRVQADKLAKGPEVIVGTPGRVLDMEERGLLDLSQISMVVLDEVDRMFDIGFRDDIRRILKLCPDRRQTVFVSATLSKDIEELARRYMHEPEKIVTTAGALTVQQVEQHYLAVMPWDKRRLLAHLLEHEEPALTIVFCRTKRTVDELVKYLERKQIEAHAIHGDMSQSKRNSVMRKFKEGSLAVLVASDVASRGIDVYGITHVINYDLPEDPDIYVHRIGRTARAGAKGVAWSLVTPEQGELLTEIENLINAEIPKMDYPDFDAREQPADWRPSVNPRGGPAWTPKKKEPMPDPIMHSAKFEPPKEMAQQVKKQEVEAKFPGGLVPSAQPKKQLRGIVRKGRR
ncbi:MAG: DEAD/DEAH box helicase [Phycisphaerales bacterium]|jgi:ATP-dependent RNA helicase DeaD|nr:DEAD/DEAH box helicase [Phycisphaerales bacterium]